MNASSRAVCIPQAPSFALRTYPGTSLEARQAAPVVRVRAVALCATQRCRRPAVPEHRTRVRAGWRPSSRACVRAANRAVGHADRFRFCVRMRPLSGHCASCVDDRLRTIAPQHSTEPMRLPMCRIRLNTRETLSLQVMDSARGTYWWECTEPHNILQ